ncbi:quinon protein alcohol dehydrogenase-like superfamily [Dunaliella salina]|uniref:Quinon protein alcohol dehydrogenase-like superfamily n=1 Tax=Dunaliella salina TaxID=3046 RepID=A0ABQ7GMT6_DUNSA|nr:quinon protein alcohol dehydrogenase-like superfamily [Dunaliella salina]|eukprot:KAF5835893.1 quinon protein alcohol dehydrogenase-like superfamily [Dunaliella salina]
MVKAYLRYEFGGAFGVVNSGPAPCYDASGKLLVTAALENLAVWNVKQGSLAATLVPGPSTSGGASTSSSHAAAAEVTCITRAPGNSPLIAAGYADGSVRIWDLSSNDCVVTLKGHKAGVTALRFSPSGAQLGSGSKDTDIILWDVVGETGLFRLRGHKDQVTDLAFVSSGGSSSYGWLVSSSKDSLVKAWDLDTQHCCQTLTGHKGEVWALDVDPAESRLVTERIFSDTSAHEGAVWSIAALPDNTGFVTGSADKTVKFWQWSVALLPGGGGAAGQRSLRLSHVRTLRMADDVLCCRVSPDGKLLAVALLDATIKVFFTDSLKFFLSLYGHKLPVLSLDISSDSTLLVSGSADKNIKVWGLDFGDCHRSSEQLLELAGHHGEVWCCAVSCFGDFVITGSHDRSLRRWQRSSEPFFVEEEKEARLESMFEADLEADKGGPQDSGAEAALAGPLGRVAAGEGEEGGAAPAGRKTLESVSAADALVDALEMAAHEEERHRDHQKQLAAGGKSGAAQGLAPNPMMLGLTGSAYVLRALSSVRASDLESALLMLPFTDALRLLGYLPTWLEQLVATASARPLLLKLHKRLHPAVQGLKDVLGVNMAALQYLQRASSERSGITTEQRLMMARKALAPR